MRVIERNKQGERERLRNIDREREIHVHGEERVIDEDREERKK